jgi:transposase
MPHAVGGRSLFPPVVLAHLVKLACELPHDARRSLALWTCAELARTLVRDDVGDTISPQTVQRLLSSQRLKPWRVHYWLSPKQPRDDEFYRRVENLCDLYTRPLQPYERVLSTDEKTSLQPRPRTAPTRPAQPDGVPVRLEHEYARAGALNLLAAFDTRSGEVIGICRRRKRQVEFIELLEAIDQRTPAAITVIHMVCDNVSTHQGKLVRAWLAQHPRFRFHFTPVHCSWTNQVEQWFSILQRKRFRYADFADLHELENAIHQFIIEWNEFAHPFHWTRDSFRKVLRQPDHATKEAA